MKLKNLFFYILILINSRLLFCQISDIGINRSPNCDLICSDSCRPCGSTLYVPRSQGDNTARQLVGWSYYLHAPEDIDCYRGYCLITSTFEFTRSFRSEKIANALFGSDCLTFSGSEFSNRTNGDIIADYFGLSPLFHRALKINPVIENYILDVNFYANLSDIFPGFYIQIFAPIVHTKWDLGLSECIACAIKPVASDTIVPLIIPSESNCDQLDIFPSNYMTVGESTCALEGLRQGLSGQTFGDMTIPWEYGKWSFCPLEKNGLADLNVQLGFNYFESILHHLGVFVKVIAPTGNKPGAKYLFEPIVGNRGHWELGGGITSHSLLWTSPYDDQAAFGIYFKGYITHVFKGNEIRSFDFNDNGLLSRYLLLKDLAISTQDIVGLNLSTANYNNQLMNAINFNTRNAQVSIDIKGEATLMFSYISQGLGFDFGYNIYGRSKENVYIKTDCPCDIDKHLLGIKGTEGVGTQQYEFDTTTEIIGNFISNVGLNSTQSKANLFIPTDEANVDNGKLLINSSTDPGQIALTYNSLNPTSTQTININDPAIIIAEASNPPVLVSCKDLNPNSASTCAQLSHKLFTNFSYRWLDTDWDPHINLGGEVEFNNNNSINKDSKKCVKYYNAVNQWGIWVKYGFCF